MVHSLRPTQTAGEIDILISSDEGALVSVLSRQIHDLGITTSASLLLEVFHNIESALRAHEASKPTFIAYTHQSLFTHSLEFRHLLSLYNNQFMMTLYYCIGNHTIAKVKVGEVDIKMAP